jgi:class 3 adenylate cyclase
VVRADDDSVTLEYPRLAVGRRRPYRSTVILNGSVPWRIEARGSLSGLTADLGPVTLQSFDAHAGASKITMTLPRPAGEVPLQLAAVAEATFRRPVGVGARVHIQSGASRLTVDDHFFKAAGGVVKWQSPDFEGSSNRYAITVLGGARDLTVGTHEADVAAERSGRAVATVLFTDIVGSTERAREEGDRRWRALLDRHDAAARRLVEDHAGELIKTTGDGILAVFPEPGRAIDGARAFRDEAQGLGMGIRAGLHAGEVEYRGTDVGGIAVHVAARIMDAAGPGEILVSRTIRDLVAGSDIGLEDRGTLTLRGVGDWQVFAVS